jgi:glutathione S-transferase
MFTLYDYDFSGNGWKVRTLLRHLARPFNIRWLDILRGEQHEPWFVAKNPVAQIPVLEDEHGRVWTESNAILETLAEGSALLPEGHQRHQIRAWLNFEQTWVDGVISRARFRRTFPDVIATPREFFEVWAAEGARALRTLDTHLTSRRYLVADRFTIADIGLYAYTHVAAEAGFRLSEYPALQAWLAHVAEQPGVLPLDENPEAQRAYAVREVPLEPRALPS